MSEPQDTPSGYGGYYPASDPHAYGASAYDPAAYNPSAYNPSAYDPYAASPYAPTPYSSGAYGPSPYAGGPYAPGPYPGYPAMPYVPAPPASGLAIASLVCAVLGFFTMGVASIGAVICGHLAWRETRDGRYSGHGMAIAGLVVGYIPLAGWLLFWLFLFVLAV